jgi:hypothetical protein
VNEGWQKHEEEENKSRPRSNSKSITKKKLQKIDEEYSSDGGYEKFNDEDSFLPTGKKKCKISTIVENFTPQRS